MQYIPIKTRVMEPPQDDLLVVLDESVTDLKEGDVVVITSKVVSIHLGQCIPLGDIDKDQLTKDQADAYMLKDDSKTLPLTIKHHALLYRAGVDDGNSGGYYTLLPKEPFKTAAMIRDHLQKKHSIKNLGVIISDSTVLPFRRGVLSISIGVAGFVPSREHGADAVDLFGEPMVATSTNLADAIAAGSSVVSGEADESIPVVIVRGVPNITYVDVVDRNKYLVNSKRDLFTPLLDKFIYPDVQE